MKMLDIPVKLIVKAPNQQIEDQIIHCSLSWTIKKLKGYLSEVYPNKPNTEDQRLIYYGQLLNDTVTLKDVFTRYEAGEETHIVHLVCMPSKESLKMQARKLSEEKNKKAKEGNLNNFLNNERQNLRESDSIDNSTHEINQSSEHLFQNTDYRHWINSFRSLSFNNNDYVQHWVWMQQLYASYYLNQYMDMIAGQNGISFRGYADSRQTEAAHNPEPPMAREMEEDNRLNRDWLDYFYILSRLLLLLTIVYFYSSPARFIIVSSLGVMLYLYQIGFFRINQLQGVENNNINNNNNNNNNNINNNNNNNINELLNNENYNVALQEIEEEHREPAAPDEINPNQLERNMENHSFIALTWTFVSSFFSSIVPEAQNAL